MLQPKKESPRGILHVPLNAPFSELHRFYPSEDLASFVEHYWAVSWDTPTPMSRETIPHPSVHMVLRSGNSLVHGVHTRRFVTTLEGAGRVLGTKFLPGAFRAFIHQSVSTLTGKMIPIAELFGQAACDLEQQAAACANPAEAFERVETFLRNLRPERTNDLDKVVSILQTITTDASITQVQHVVERFEVGLRKLQRMFTEYVGCSPKWVIQRCRLIEASERLRHAPEQIDFAMLALDLGYSDQSHFVRDFKQFVGMSPAQYQKSLQANSQSAADSSGKS